MSMLSLLPVLLTFVILLASSFDNKRTCRQPAWSGSTCPTKFVEESNSDLEEPHTSFIQSYTILAHEQPEYSLISKKPLQTSVDGFLDSLPKSAQDTIKSLAPTKERYPSQGGGLFTWTHIAICCLSLVVIALVVCLCRSVGSAQDSKEVIDETNTEPVPYLWRAIMASLIFSENVFNFSDRYNISVAILELAEENSYSELTMGFIQSAFYIGFFVSSIIFGVLASPSSKWGPKWSLSCACAAWSLFTVLTPVCADTSLELLVVARIGLGFAEGAAFPCAIALISTWFPPTQRAQVASVANCGQSLGAALAMACSPITMYNWRIMFYVFGAFGFFWVALFVALAADSPAQHAGISKEEKEHIERSIETMNKSSNNDAAPASYLQIVQSSAVWATYVADMSSNVTWLILLSWIPTFYAYNFALSTSAAGQMGMISYFLAAGSVLCWGSLFDGLLHWWGEAALRRIRLLAVATMLVGPSIFLAVLLFAKSKASMVFQGLLLSLTIICATASWSGTKANLIDIGGTLDSARLAAVMASLSSVPAVFGNVAVGYYLSQPSLGWNAVFITMIVVNILGFMTFAKFMQVERVQF